MSDSSNTKKRGKDARLVENGIYQVENNVFDVRVRKRIGGKEESKFKRKVRFLGPARQVRDQFITELNNLKNVVENGDVKWSEALEQYFKYRKDQVADKTFINQQQIVNKHTEDWFDISISEFKQEFIVQDLQKKLKNYPKSTVQSIIKHIRLVFEYHFNKINSPLTHNPCKGIKPWGRVNKNEVAEIPKMTMEEIKTLLKHTEETGSEWHPIFFVAYHTGMRSGELWALKWGDISPDYKSLTVKRSYCSTSKKEKPPKNGKPRTIPLNNSLMNFLIKLKQTSSSPTYVLPHLKIWENGGVAKILRAYQRQLGISQTSFHSIRASHITHLLLKNVPPITVMYLAGHADYKTTDRYVREIQKERAIDQSTNVLDEVFESNVRHLKTGS